MRGVGEPSFESDLPPGSDLSLWTKQSFFRWITNVSDGSDAISSVQNGLMLRNDLQLLTDNYIISINPDV